MPRYEVVLSVVVDAEDSDDAFAKALNGEHDRAETIVEEDGIRILPDPIFLLTDKGQEAIKENA